MPEPIKIASANLHFNADGAPIADDFDDVYFSSNDGLAETQYVFLSANQLSRRWRELSRMTFTVAETGFGSGMNFLACWQAFADHLALHPDASCQRLHFVSFEKFPMTAAALAQCHLQFPSLQHYAKQLQQHYPMALSGCHRLSFAQGRVTLDLWFGDVNQLTPQVTCKEEGLVDAWFLDGFAPSKNPDMWSDKLFSQMYRLARANCTLATFTAAGFVRRGLTESGFAVKKITGYGHKRDMTVAHKPSLPQPTPSANTKQITIIGGGIAACFAGYELAQRGFKVRLLCADDALAQQASGNRQGALYPLVSASADQKSQFFSLAYGYALNQMKQLIQRHPTIAHQWCGVLHLNSNDELTRKHDALAQAGLPEALVQPLNAQQASALAGVELPHAGVAYPQGGWICPGDLCRAIADELNEQDHQIELNAKVTALKTSAGRWQLETDKAHYQSDVVIIAAGTDSTAFEQSALLPLSAVRGQVSHVPITTDSATLKTVLCHTGYLTPGHHDSHCLGASFVRNSDKCELKLDEHQSNLERLNRALFDAEWIAPWQQSPLAGHVGFRATVRDHLPLVGPLPDWQQLPQLANTTALAALPTQENIYLLSGLGARGLCSAPLSAAILAAYISGESQPLSQDLLHAVHPGRFVCQRLQKNRPLFAPSTEPKER